MSDSKPTVTVEALTYHTFNGAPHKAGDIYTVSGDSTQTAEQYADTLTHLQFAKRAAKPEPPKADPPKSKSK